MNGLMSEWIIGVLTRGFVYINMYIYEYVFGNRFETQNQRGD